MPGGNGTGPLGEGPMTGRGAGYCTGFSQPGSMNGMVGRGGRGRRNRNFQFGQTGWLRPANWSTGFRPSPVQNISRDQELDILKNQAGIMQNSLKEINSRITEMESGKSQ